MTASTPPSGPDLSLPKQPNSDVFISYSRKDAALMKQLHANLTQIERDVWVDWEDITPSDNWLTAIFDAIEKTNTFLVIISPNSITSPICNFEIEHAVQLNKRLVPIVYQDVNLDVAKQEISQKPLSQSTLDILGGRPILDLLQENWTALSHPSWLYFRTEDEFKTNFPRLIDALDTNLFHVHEHTRWLVPAVEWEKKKRNPSFLLGGEQLREAEIWLSNSKGMDPQPTKLHYEYIQSSRQIENRQQRTRNIIVALAFIGVLILAAYGLLQSQSAQRALGTAEARGTEVANQGLLAANNAATAQANAFMAGNNAASAIAAQNIAEARGTEVANQVVIAANNASTAQANAQIALNNAVTATIAQGQAQIEAGNAATQAAIAGTEAARAQNAATAESNARATSVINEKNAIDNAATATIAQGQAQNEANNAATQAAIAVIEADRAQNAATAESNARATSVINEKNAIDNAATATIAQGQAQNEANNAATQAANAQNAATAESNARATSVINEKNANNNAATANHAQGIAEARGTEVANQVVIAANNAATAQANAQIALNNAATATIAQGQAQNEANNAATQAANAQNAATAESNARATSVINEKNAINNAATATIAQGQALIAAGQALSAQATAEKRSYETQSFALTVAIEQLVSLGNPDLAVALALEAVRLDPNSWVAQNRLLKVVFAPGTRLVFKPEAGADIAGFDMSSVTKSVTQVSYSPNGKYVASASLDGSITLWDARTGTQLKRFTGGHTTGVNSVAFSPDSQLIVSASNDKSLIIWDLDGKIVRRIELLDVNGQRMHLAATTAVFRPDGRTIISGWGDGRVILFDVATGAVRLELSKVSTVPIMHLELSPDQLGQFFLAITSVNVSVWDTKSVTQRSLLIGKDGAGAYSPDGNYVLISAASNENANPNGNDLILREISSRQEKGRYRGHTAPVTDVAFMPDGSAALSGGQDGVIILWDIRKQTEIRRYYGSGNPIISLTVSPDGQSFVSVDSRGQIRLWDTVSDGLIRSLPPAKQVLLDLQYSRDNQTILASYDDQSVGFWNVAEGTESNRRFYHQNIITSFSYSPDEKNVLIADASGTVTLWKADTYRELMRFSASGGAAVAAFSPDGSTIATGTALGAIRFWDAATGKRKLLHDPDAGPITAIRYSKDGSTLFTVHPNAIVIRNSQTGDIIRYFTSQWQIAHAVLSNDERWLLTSSGNNVILWDFSKDNGAPKIFGGDGEPHTKTVTGLAFSPDGTAALSSGEDGDIRLWDLANGRLLFVYRNGDAIPYSVVFAADGRSFAASYGRQIVMLWSGTRSVLPEWIKQNRYLPEVTCADREKYSLSPLCTADGLVPTLTPTPIQLPTLIPTVTPVPGPTATPTVAPLPVGRITAQGKVNVRTDKADNAQLVTQLSSGAEVSVLEDPRLSPGWVHIATQDGKIGWIRANLVDITGTFAGSQNVIPFIPTSVPTASNNRSAVLVKLISSNGSNINIRSGAGDSFKLIARVPSGTQALQIDTPLGAWAHVRLVDGTEGWVSRSVIK